MAISDRPRLKAQALVAEGMYSNDTPSEGDLAAAISEILAEHPDVEETGDGYRFTFMAAKAIITVTRLSENHAGLYGEVTAETVAGGIIHGPSRTLLTGGNGRRDLAKALSVVAPSAQWSKIVDIVSRETVSRFRQGDPIVLLEGDVSAPASPFLDPLVPSGRPGVLYGDGGTCKSLLALAACVAVSSGARVPGLFPKTQTDALYLDWETSRDDKLELLAALRPCLGAEGGNVHYRFMSRPLADDAVFLKAEIRRLGIGFVVVDSWQPACGAFVDDVSGAVTRAMAAVRFLEIPALIVAHVPKAEANGDGPARPYGSVFTWNLAGSLWEARASAAEGDADETVIGLYHRKANRGRLRRPLGFRVTYEKDLPTGLYRADPADDGKLSRSLTLPERVLDELKGGALTAPDLATMMGEKGNKIRTTLHRLLMQEKVVRLGAVGAKGDIRWGLPASKAQHKT